MPILPPKFLRIDVANVLATALWNDDDGSGDPWLGTPYRWSCELTVTPQFHSSHATPTPYQYNGADIKVGDWFSTIEGGLAVRIISITSQNAVNATVEVEDMERYNTFADPNGGGSGAPPAGSGFLFSLGDDGLPIMGPIQPGLFTAAYQTDLMSRFIFRNEMRSYQRVFQAGHSFAIGDALYIDSSGVYHKTLATSNVDNVVGFVNSISTPGIGWFTYRPIGRIVENIAPPLPGNVGDLLYLSATTPGQFTATRPDDNARAVYLKLTSTTAVQVNDGPTSEARSVKMMPSTNDQTEFTLPADARQVIEMSINGVENTNYTFDPPTLTFDPVATGYGVETSDEVIFVYTT